MFISRMDVINDLCICVLHLKLWMLAMIQGLALQSQGSLFLYKGGILHDTFAGSTATPSPDTTCPRNPTSFSQNSHLLNLAYNLCSLSFSNTKCRCASFSCSFLEYTNISLINTPTNLSKNSINTLFIIFMKYAGALVNPNDITVYSYNPYLVVKAVFGISPSQIFN